MQLGINEWVAIGSAALALVSLVLNWLVVRRQTELQYETLKAEMDADVIAWAHEAIDLISQAAALARGRGVIHRGEEFSLLAAEVEHRLSAAADKGRLFFPNEDPDGHGFDRGGAFRGIRPPVLDALIFTCCQLEQLRRSPGDGPDHEAASLLTKCKRMLVSEAQNAIDPRRRAAMMRRLSIGRNDDVVSNWEEALAIGSALNERYPNVPAIVAFMNAHTDYKGRA